MNYFSGFIDIIFQHRITHKTSILFINIKRNSRYQWQAYQFTVFFLSITVQ